MSKTKSTKLIFYIMKDLYNSSHMWFLIDVIVNLLVSVCGLVTTLLFERLFDNVGDLLEGKQNVSIIMGSAIFLGLSIISKRFIDIICTYTGTGALAKYTKKYVQEKIHKKMEEIPAELYEDSNMLDMFSKVNECTERGYGVYGGISLIFTFFLPYILLMTGYFFSVLPILAFITGIVIFTQLFIHTFKLRFVVRMEEETMNLKRRLVEYETYLYDIRYFKDTLLNNAFDYFMDQRREMITSYNILVLKYEKKQLAINIITKFITLFGYSSIFFILYSNLIRSTISVGAFAAIFSCLGNLFGMIEGLISIPLKRLNDALAIVKYYYEFMHRKFEIPEKVDGDIEQIRLEKVCFKYPNATENILKNITLEIRKGEIIALVGPNGSGKSTLSKILVGLYTPSEGKLYINDCEKEIPYGFRGKISAAFQNFEKYKLSVYDNIHVAECNKDEDIDEYLIRMNTDLNKKGITKDTVLAREFGGKELSGGEWQKLAISRAMYKDHSFIVLDEPTASIDPVEETKIYRDFFNNEKEKTIILLTHRIGAARYADRIVVMNHGEIVEVGMHDELMDSKGLYYEMYNTQAKWYA